jgi:hypothetical protein
MFAVLLQSESGGDLMAVLPGSFEAVVNSFLTRVMVMLSQRCFMIARYGFCCLSVEGLLASCGGDFDRFWGGTCHELMMKQKLWKDLQRVSQKLGSCII